MVCALRLGMRPSAGLVRKRALASQPQTRNPERLPTAMDEKKAIQKDKLRAAPLIKLNAVSYTHLTLPTILLV